MNEYPVVRLYPFLSSGKSGNYLKLTTPWKGEIVQHKISVNIPFPGSLYYIINPTETSMHPSKFPHTKRFVNQVWFPPPHKKRTCSWSRLFFRIPSGPNHHISEWLAFGVPGIYDSNMFQQTKKKARNRYAQTFFAKKKSAGLQVLVQNSSLRKHFQNLGAKNHFFRTHIASTWPIPFATSHAPTFRRRRGGPRWRNRCKWHGIHWPLCWPGGGEQNTWMSQELSKWLVNCL